MKLIGREDLESFKNRHGEVRIPCESWEQEVLHATWTTPQDIKDRYSSASFLPHNRVIFNIKGPKYRIGTMVHFPTMTVFVEWALTHAEYSKKFR